MPSRDARPTPYTGSAGSEATWPRRPARALTLAATGRKPAPAVGRDRLATAATPTLQRYAAALERRISSRHAHLDDYRAYVDVQRVLRERPRRYR